MIRSARSVLSGLLLVGVAAATGCEKGPTRPPIDASAIVGSWIELADQGPPSPRVQPRKEQTHLRHLTLKEGKTFEFSLRTKAGKPTKHKIEGTWAIEDNEVVFKVSSSTFADNDERRDWAPESSLGIRRKDVSGRGEVEVFSIVDLEGFQTSYVREE